MEIAVLVLSIIACAFSTLALVASLSVGVIVIGWKNSTHRIEYRKPDETTYEIDAPPEVRDQIPSAPEAMSLQQWARSQQSQLDQVYEQDLGA